MLLPGTANPSDAPSSVQIQGVFAQKMPPVLLLPEKESFHWNPATSDIRDRLLILHNFFLQNAEILLPEIFTDQIRLFLKQQPGGLSAAKHWTCDDLLRTTKDTSCLPRQDGLICSSDIPSFQIPLCPKMRISQILIMHLLPR